MNNRIKDYLGIVAIIAVLVGAFAAASFARSYSKALEPSSFRSFSVSADSKVNATPDVARFTFSVITEGGKDIATLQQQNTERSNKAIDFIKSKGIEAKDIKTQQYDIQPRQQYYSCNSGVGSSAGQPCPPPQIVGYTITQTVEVKVRDFKKISDVLGGVVDAGANTVSQLAFVIDDPSAQQDSARGEAIQKAKKKAQAIADAGGFSLGRLLEIQDGGSYNPPLPYYDRAGGMGVTMESTKSIAPAIEPGSQDVQVTVTLRYEIE